LQQEFRERYFAFSAAPVAVAQTRRRTAMQRGWREGDPEHDADSRRVRMMFGHQRHGWSTGRECAAARLARSPSLSANAIPDRHRAPPFGVKYRAARHAHHHDVGDEDGTGPLGRMFAGRQNSAEGRRATMPGRRIFGPDGAEDCAPSPMVPGDVAEQGKRKTLQFSVQADLRRRTPQRFCPRSVSGM